MLDNNGNAFADIILYNRSSEEVTVSATTQTFYATQGKVYIQIIGNSSASKWHDVYQVDVSEYEAVFHYRDLDNDLAASTFTASQFSFIDESFHNGSIEEI